MVKKYHYNTKNMAYIAVKIDKKREAMLEVNGRVLWHDKDKARKALLFYRDQQGVIGRGGFHRPVIKSQSFDKEDPLYHALSDRIRLRGERGKGLE